MTEQEQGSPIPPPEDVDIDDVMSDASGDTAKVPSEDEPMSGASEAEYPEDAPVAETGETADPPDEAAP